MEQAIRDASEEGELDKEEGSMLLSVLTLDDLQVQDIMTPRTDIACSSTEDAIRQVAELIISSGHSRIPIFSGNRDNIIGIVHAKDLLRHTIDPSGQNLPATAIMREPFFVPETKNVLDLLQEFRARKLHLAVILDEYGGTAGLVSIEDVLEQIVGDIEDEHDAPREQSIVAQADGSCLIAGRTYLDEIAETLTVSITSEEVDTLGGYLTHLAGRVPKAGEEFAVDGRVFRIVSSDVKQIHRVRMLPADYAGTSAVSREASAEKSAILSHQKAGPPQTENTGTPASSVHTRTGFATTVSEQHETESDTVVVEQNQLNDADIGLTKECFTDHLQLPQIPAGQEQQRAKRHETAERQTAASEI